MGKDGRQLAFELQFPKNLIPCPPVSLFQELTGSVKPAAGSIETPCELCGRPVYVAPSLWITAHDNPGARLSCISCVVEKEGQCRLSLADYTNAQIKEISDYFDKKGGCHGNRKSSDHH